MGWTDGDGAGDEADGEACGVAVGMTLDGSGAVGVGRSSVCAGLGAGVHATARTTIAPRSDNDVWVLLGATVLFMCAGQTGSHLVVWLDRMSAALTQRRQMSLAAGALYQIASQDVSALPFEVED